MSRYGISLPMAIFLEVTAIYRAPGSLRMACCIAYSDHIFMGEFRFLWQISRNASRDASHHHAAYFVALTRDYIWCDFEFAIVIWCWAIYLIFRRQAKAIIYMTSDVFFLMTPHLLQGIIFYKQYRPPAHGFLLSFIGARSISVWVTARFDFLLFTSFWHYLSAFDWYERLYIRECLCLSGANSLWFSVLAEARLIWYLAVVIDIDW